MHPLPDADKPSPRRRCSWEQTQMHQGPGTTECGTAFADKSGIWIAVTHLLPVRFLNRQKSPAALLDRTRNAAGLIVWLPPSAAAVLAGRKGQRGNDVLYGLRALPPTRPSAVFCGFQNFTVPRLRSTRMPSCALRLNLPAFLALNLMVKSSWLPSSRRKLLPRLTKVG